jgi:putative membrane protein
LRDADQRAALRAASQLNEDRPMRISTRLVVGFVTLQHIAFFVLEAFLWTSDAGRDVFKTTAEFAEASRALAANQGLYNLFLAAALIVAQIVKDEKLARAFATFGLACVFVAGVVGAVTAKPDILVVQALPGLIALVLVRVRF